MTFDIGIVCKSLLESPSVNKIIALKSNVKGDYNIVRGYGNSSGDFDFMQISDQIYPRLPNGEYIIWQK